MPKKNSDARIRANNKYTEKAYDRINLAVKKGGKEKIEAIARARGLSINGFIVELLKPYLEEEPEALMDPESQDEQE